MHTQAIPVNEAEAVVDPFWDPQQSEFDKWEVKPGEGHGLVVNQNWCNVVFSWMRRPAQGPALEMSRDLVLDCRGYTHLVLSAFAPSGSVIRLVAETEQGRKIAETAPIDDDIGKREVALDLEGASWVETVRVAVDAGSEGQAQGSLNWLGLEHRHRLEAKLEHKAKYQPTWEKHLKDQSAEISFEPEYGLVFTPDELESLRKRHDAALAKHGESPFVNAGKRARRIVPEDLIGDYVNFWNDKRHNRIREHDNFILNHGVNAALAGHLLKDKELLRIAARYALSIGMCKHWDDGFINCLPGGTWEHRCFVHSLCAFDVALILDLAGECFTKLGRDFLLRRLSEEAIGFIQYNTWKYDYIFRCNQLAWFTPGRMAALAVLNKHWPRVRPYLDIAYHELCDSMEQSILPDGGYPEGPMYFRCVGRDAGLGVYFYSRALEQPMPDRIPDAIKRCDNFAELLLSTQEGADMIPICDAKGNHPLISQAMMAQLLPDSAWATMLERTMARHDGWPVALPDNPEAVSAPAMIDAAIAWQLADTVPKPSFQPHPLLVMPDMGPAASHRRWGNHWVKLFIQGNHGGAGHTHEDKGSFVLEFAGDTFAADPGSCDYSSPLSGVLKTCQRHNMLIPTGIDERPAPQCPLPVDVKPAATGDETSFRAEIDLTPGWKSYYAKWHRTWESPTPDLLTITDEYELVKGDGVVFYWQTRLPASVTANQAVITGSKGAVELTAPQESEWTLEELPLLDGTQYRLALAWPHPCGQLVIRARLIGASAPS